MIIFITIIFVQMLILILFPYVNIIFLYLVKYLVINKENNLELEKRKKNIFTRDSLFNINKVNLSIIYFNSNLF